MLQQQQQQQQQQREIVSNPYSYEEAMDRALAEGKDNLQYERNPHDPAEQAISQKLRKRAQTWVNFSSMFPPLPPHSLRGHAVTMAHMFALSCAGGLREPTDDDDFDAEAEEAAAEDEKAAAAAEEVMAVITSSAAAEPPVAAAEPPALAAASAAEEAVPAAAQPAVQDPAPMDME